MSCEWAGMVHRHNNYESGALTKIEVIFVTFTLQSGRHYDLLWSFFSTREGAIYEAQICTILLPWKYICFCLFLP